MYVSPWAQVGQTIANMIIMKHFQDQQKKDAGLLANALSPVDYQTTQTDTSYQFADTTGQGVKNKTAQGLLPTYFDTGSQTPDMLGQGLLQMVPQLGQGLLQMKPQLAQGALQAAPKQAVDFGDFVNPLDRFSPERTENKVTATTTTKEMGLPDIQKQIRAAWQKKVQADIKNMSPEGARQYITAARQSLKEQLDQAKEDYQAEKASAYIAKLPVEMQTAYNLTKMGVPDTIIKRLFPEQPTTVSNGSWVRDDSAPGGYRQIGTIERNRPHVQLANGNVGLINPDGTVQDTGVAFYQRPVSGGSRGGGGAGSSGNVKETGLLALYKDATETIIEPTGEFDVYGKPIMTRRVKNPELAQKLQPFIDEIVRRNTPQTQQAQTGVNIDRNNYDQAMSDAIAAGRLTPEQARKIREMDGMPNDSSFWG